MAQLVVKVRHVQQECRLRERDMHGAGGQMHKIVVARRARRRGAWKRQAYVSVHCGQCIAEKHGLLRLAVQWRQAASLDRGDGPGAHLQDPHRLGGSAVHAAAVRQCAGPLQQAHLRF